MRQPKEPNQEDCCNSGCNPCIFDVYAKHIKLYKKFLEHGENFSEPVVENAISQLEYSAFVVADNINLCESHTLLTFKKKVEDDKKLKWRPGQHFLFKFNDQNNGCTRAYTPVNVKARMSDGNFDFAIIIKRYENGLVSNFLSCLNKGDETLWRGPYGSYEITENKFSRIIMLAQGTGIAPFMSIIEEILNNEENMTKILLLYCSHSIDTILFRDELYKFKSFWNFSYDVFVSNISDKFVKYKYQEPIKNIKLTNEILDQYKPLPQKDQFLLCGSQKFMENYKLWLLGKNIAQEDIILF
ncbi:NADH-cytochrome b5 reductase-like [Manduca sexta]|uniref:NADH-cytochrome b5 reductase n=1 Tax=Manduca sexta TaxID=7130 RepID=A0A922CS78_MANSE|nr:NADH-cytochrome b5 reductase-like [Manduca sexta]KAG6456442.1 hypothetical protein O3G_MSEX009724 [Manduca sexta]